MSDKRLVLEWDQIMNTFVLKSIPENENSMASVRKCENELRVLQKRFDLTCQHHEPNFFKKRSHHSALSWFMVEPVH